MQAIIQACEPQPRGRKRTLQDDVDALQKENSKLRHEISRLQAVVRAAQRSIGLPSAAPPAKSKTGGKRPRKRSRTPRAQRVVAALRKPEADVEENSQIPCHESGDGSQ